MVQTYTHVVVGVALGTTLFHDNYPAQVACIISSVAPDVPAASQFLFDLLHGRKPLEHQGNKLMLLQEISHSLPLWILLLLLTWLLNFSWQVIGYALAVGGIGHILIDVFTHGKGSKEKRKFTGLTFIWPLQFDLRTFGVWEYRIYPGILRPKLPEVILILVCFVIIVVAFVL